MGIRYLLLAVAIWALFILLRHLLKRPEKRRPEERPIPENMVACARCGIHLPESEALKKGDLYFCCREHMRLGDQDG
jgi:uncharacterized protein